MNELIYNTMYERGKADALDLAKRAQGMDGTAIIDEEEKVPLFVWGTDYSGCPVDTPIAEIIEGEKQIFTMIVPVNTVKYPGITPNTERSLYSLRHTKNPRKAKAFMYPYGTSGMYKLDECCTEGSYVWRNIYPNNDFPPSAVPDRWENLGTVKEIMEG